MLDVTNTKTIERATREALEQLASFRIESWQCGQDGSVVVAATMTARRLEERLHWRKRDHEGPRCVLVRRGNDAEPFETAQELHNGFTHDRHTASAVVAAAGDDENLSVLLRLVPSQPLFGPEGCVLRRWQARAQIQGPIGAKARFFQRAQSGRNARTPVRHVYFKAARKIRPSSRSVGAVFVIQARVGAMSTTRAIVVYVPVLNQLP